MNTVELFAGIGGFRIAADRRGYRTIWANDSCPKASAVYRDRFGSEVLREADISSVIGEVPRHDLLTGGFPCQPFSSAGKKQGIRDTRGTRFQSIVDVLRRHRPQFFVLENVKRLLTMERGWHFATILGALTELDYLTEWRLLNARHFGLPQNRERIVLVGSRMTNLERSASTIKLATGSDLRTLSALDREELFDFDGWREVKAHSGRFPEWGIVFAGRFFAADLPDFSEAQPQRVLRAVLEPTVSPDFDFTEATLKWLSANSPVDRFVNGVEILSNQQGGARMGYTIFGINGLAPTLTSTTSRHYERYKVGDCYRRLTNVEYARIQGFPDDHCRAVSVYDQYALFGNAVPPAMVGWVLERLRIEPLALTDIPPGPRTLFDHAG